VNVNVPVAGPVAVGANVTPTAQFEPAATGVVQVLETTVNPVLAATLLIVRLVLKRFVKVTFRVELVCPTVTVPKFSELVENVTGAEPEPDRLTVCGLFGALSAKVSVPLAAPTAVGENVTPTWQRAPAARLVVQVLLEIANGAAVVMEVIDSATDCMFVRVTVLAELVAPTTVELKLKLFEDNVTGALPLPLRFTVCGLVATLSVKVRVPVALPSAVGLNVTPTAQVAPGATAPEQVLLAIANGPDIATPEMFRGTFWAFVRVSVCAELVAPTTVELKFKALGENVTARDPVPLKETVCGLVSAESVKVRVPVAEPSAVGVNVTLTVQVPEAATLVPQVFAEMANGPLAVMLVKLSAELRRLVTVTVFAALVSLTAMLPKLRLLEDRLTGLLPLPERLTDCTPALSVIVRDPETEPNAVGVNVT
jgi:hypothetical protein